MSRRSIAAVTAISAVVIGAIVLVRAGRGNSTPRADATDAIVMLGDSITEEGDWAALLPEWPIANRGYSGYTTAQLVDEAAAVATHGPRMVFVLTGTNDIRDGHPPSWTIAALEELLDRLRAGAPDAVVVLQTILPRADARDAVLAANAAIRQLAVERGVELLDLHAAFDDGTGALRAAETTDGLHLAPAGYVRWAGLLEEALRRLSPITP